MFEHHYTQIPSEVKYKNQQKNHTPPGPFHRPLHARQRRRATRLRCRYPFPMLPRCCADRPPAPAAAAAGQRACCPPPLQVAKYVDHPRKPRQLACKAAAQLRRVFITLADIEKAASTVNGKVQSAIAIEIHGEFSEGGIRQRQDPRRTVGHQDAQSGSFIAAAHTKAPVKVLIARSDGFDAQKPVQPLSRPDGQPCGKRAAEFTQQPLAGIDLMLGFLPLSAFLALKRVHLRQLDGAQLRSQSLICPADVPAAAAIAVAGQRDVRVLGVEKMRSGIDLHIL